MNNSIQTQVAAAINAAEDKKADNVAILQMDKASSAFTDYFVIASGNNPRQVQAIADEIELRLKQAGNMPNSVEGYQQAEWILLDYVDFVIHVFSESARKFYDLERLWKSAKRVTVNELKSRVTRPRGVSTQNGAGARKKPAASAARKSASKAIRAATLRSKPVETKSKTRSASKVRAQAKKNSGAKSKARKSR